MYIGPWQEYRLAQVVRHRKAAASSLQNFYRQWQDLDSQPYGQVSEEKKRQLLHDFMQAHLSKEADSLMRPDVKLRKIMAPRSKAALKPKGVKKVEQMKKAYIRKRSYSYPVNIKAKGRLPQPQTDERQETCSPDLLKDGTERRPISQEPESEPCGQKNQVSFLSTSDIMKEYGRPSILPTMPCQTSSDMEYVQRPDIQFPEQAKPNTLFQAFPTIPGKTNIPSKPTTLFETFPTIHSSTRRDFSTKFNFGGNRNDNVPNHYINYQRSENSNNGDGLSKRIVDPLTEKLPEINHSPNKRECNIAVDLESLEIDGLQNNNDASLKSPDINEEEVDELLSWTNTLGNNTEYF